MKLTDKELTDLDMWASQDLMSCDRDAIYAVTEEVRTLRALADAVKTWREAKCQAPRNSRGFHMPSQECDGDNHQMECPVERARQDLIHVHNKVSV